MKRMFFLVILACGWCDIAASVEPISSKVRKQAIHQAQVWKATDVAKMDILAGPQNEISVPLDAMVECEYIEPKKELSGVIPKFLCKDSTGHTLRVKYGQENKEVYSEVAATRLFWALGFYADEVYPVQVRCNNCPDHPFHPEPDSKRGTFLFKDAIIEREFQGTILEEKEDQGWTWKELEEVDLEVGGAPRSHVDALRLLAVFVQDADTKPDNQRLACIKPMVEGEGNRMEFCPQPIMMVQDLGATFGSGFNGLHINKMEVSEWKRKKIWNRQLEAKRSLETGSPVCIGNITSSKLAGEEGLNDPVISEDGRKFLADLLARLTDQQIRDLFTVARVERMSDEKEDSIDTWVTAFKEKRTEILEGSCGK